MKDEILTELAERYDTPLYVTDAERIIERYRMLKNAFREKTRIYYSCKANTNLSILRLLHREGSFVDAVSVGEVLACLKAGFQKDMIMFTGTGVRDDELKFLAERGIMVNIDSFSEMRRLCAIAERPMDLSFRLNPGVGAGHSEKTITGNRESKFGMKKEELERAVVFAMERGHRIKAIQCHIGSGILNDEPFIKAAEVLNETADGIEMRTGAALEFLDIGGGFGVPYAGEKELDVEGLALRLSGMIDRPLAIEPGRYIVADSTVLLTRVNTIKSNGGKSFAEVDAGFNTLIRPAMYGSYHNIKLVAAERAGKERYDIVGPLCESGDFLARDREMPQLEEGDLLAVENAGAYGFSMSSNYNSRPRAAEILIIDGKSRVMRERESYEDIFAGQRVVL